MFISTLSCSMRWFPESASDWWPSAVTVSMDADVPTLLVYEVAVSLAVYIAHSVGACFPFSNVEVEG